MNRLIDEAEQRTASPLQDYVLDRLDGASGPEWLDSQKMEQAVLSTEMLGRASSSARRRSLPK